MTNHIRLALAVATLLSACSGASTAPFDANSSGITAPSAAPAPSVKLGATGKAGGVDLTVTDVATPSKVGPTGSGPSAEPSETFVVVSYTIKNTSGKPMPYLERPNLGLIDAKGQRYAPDEVAATMAAGMMDDTSGMTSDLNPNVSAKTKTAWKVEKAAFDRATWRVVVATDPALTFALK